MMCKSCFAETQNLAMFIWTFISSK